MRANKFFDCLHLSLSSFYTLLYRSSKYTFLFVQFSTYLLAHFTFLNMCCNSCTQKRTAIFWFPFYLLFLFGPISSLSSFLPQLLFHTHKSVYIHHKEYMVVRVSEWCGEEGEGHRNTSGSIKCFSMPWRKTATIITGIALYLYFIFIIQCYVQCTRYVHHLLLQKINKISRLLILLLIAT